MMSPRWGWDDVALLGLGLWHPAGAGMMSPRWGYRFIPLGRGVPGGRGEILLLS